jgi:hypothetical protein
MPLSKNVATAIKGLDFNLKVFGEEDWGMETRKRLIDESVELIDEIILDPVFCFTLQIAYATKGSSEEQLDIYIRDATALLSFLEKEKLLLAGSGLHEEFVQQLVDKTKEVVERGLKGLSSPEEVFKAVVRMKFALLDARDVPQRPGWIKVARSLAISLGGAALVSLNATGWAASMGITGPLSALSAAAGGAILGEGAKDILALISG